MAVALSGSIVLEGSITGSLLGTSSYSSNAGLLNGLDSSVFALTSSLGSFTSSLNDFSSSINTYTASNNANIAAINAATASLYNATASLYGATSSLFNYSASSNLRINALDQYTASLNTRSASFACIDSTNNFACVQYFSNASNAVSFTSTGSLYSDGGMRLTKDLYVSGTSYFNNVTIFGTQSVNYITSSQLNIASNIITVNTATPTVRFGGLAVYDSGSLGTGLTGSMLWDSEDNQWIYSNPSGSTYDSAVFLVGPRNTGVLGNEPGISCNFLSKGNGMHHMTSSAIFEDGSRTCFYGTTVIGSGGTVCTTMANASCVGIGTTTPAAQFHIFNNNTYSAANLNETTSSAMAFRIRTRAGINTNIVMGAFDSTQAGLQVVDSATAAAGCFLINPYGGNVGIGCIAPIYPLDVKGAAGTIARITDGTSHITFYAGSGLNEIATVSPMLLTVNGAERLRIASTGIACFACQVCAPMVLASGCVGINITDPLTRLHVQFAGTTTTTCMACLKDGALVLYNANAGSSTNGTVGIFGQNAGALGLSSGIGFSRESSANWGTQLRFYTHPTTTSEIDVVCERMRITGDGCLSIGTTCTLGKLTVASDAGTSGITLLNTTAATVGTETQFITWEGLTNGSALHACPLGRIGVINVNGGTSIGTMVFYTKQYNAGICERMRITSDGNVGIGLTTPQYALSIQRTGNVALHFSTNGCYTGDFIDITGGGQCTVTDGNSAFRIRSVVTAPSGKATGNLGFWVNCGDKLVERMHISCAGNVGIGNAAPPFGLTVYRPSIGQGDTSTNLLLFDTTSYATGAGGGVSFGGYYDNTNSEIYTYGYVKGGKENSTNGNFSGYVSFGTRVQDCGSAVERMRITSDGNVGIGITNPGAKLQVKTSVGVGATDAFYIENPSSALFEVRDDGLIYMKGNVGIGTTNPINKFQVTNRVSTTYSPTSFNNDLHAMHIQFCDQNQGAGLIRWTSHGNLENSFGVVQVCASCGTDCGQGDFIFQAYKSAALGGYSELMRITRLGNVGIGTTDPGGYKLKVQNTSTTGISIQTVGSTSSSPQLQILNGAVDTTIAASSNGLELTAYSSHALLLKTANVERMRITTGGTLQMAATTISNNNAPFGAEANGGYKYFQGTLANGEKFGSQGGTYIQGFFLISWFDGSSGRGYAIYATTNPAANAGTVLISSGGTYTASATYNASSAVSLAFDGSSRGAVLSNNTGATLTFYAYVFGGV